MLAEACPSLHRGPEPLLARRKAATLKDYLHRIREAETALVSDINEYCQHWDNLP